MKRDPLLYAVIGALIGGVVVWFMSANAVNSNNFGMMRMMGMRVENTMDDSKDEGMDMMHNQMADDGMSMDVMVESLKGKIGDEFDKAFIEGMIEHHQGAINMAKLAQQYAGHEEIKNLADAIITAQTSEIEMMRQWWNSWGY